MAKGKDLDDIPHERKEPRPDFSVQPERKPLPKSIQDTLDDDEKLWVALYEGKSADSVDTNVRYAAYANRVRTILRTAHRYIAYTSDIGESFRPVAHPYLVRGAYAVSWAYIAGDVANEGYKAYLRNQRVLAPGLHLAPPDAGDRSGVVEGAPGTRRVEVVTGRELPKPPEEAVRRMGVAGVGGQEDGIFVPGKVPLIEDYRAVMAQRAVFQSVASMGLPAFTIHSVVKYSGRALKGATNVTLRTYAPIGLGLAIVPALPYMFDEPVEKAVEWTFHKAFEAIGGPDAVKGQPVLGKKEMRSTQSKIGAEQDKEL